MRFPVRLACMLTAAFIGTTAFGAEENQTKQVEAKPATNEIYDWVGFQWGVCPYLQIFNENTKINGFRLSTLYSKNTEMTGFDLGVFPCAEDATGLQISVANVNTGTTMGAQLGVVNTSDGKMDGTQIGAVNSAGSVKGAQLGYVNISDKDSYGTQLGIVNISPANFCGFQLGFINTSGDENTDNGDKKCFQLGFLNFNKHGFLPFMILFNF